MGVIATRRWAEIKDELPSDSSTLQPTDTIEMQPSLGDDSDDDGGVDSGHGGRDQGQPTYKVYKRRWFGLVQLTLLNIIVSLDVREP